MTSYLFVVTCWNDPRKEEVLLSKAGASSPIDLLRLMQRRIGVAEFLAADRFRVHNSLLGEMSSGNLCCRTGWVETPAAVLRGLEVDLIIP